MGILDTIKAYAAAIKLALGILLIAGAAFAWWHHGNLRYSEGQAEVQALWDADKKISADTIIASLTANEALKSNLEINKNESQKRIDSLAADNKRLRVLLPQFQVLSAAGTSRKVMVQRETDSKYAYMAKVEWQVVEVVK